MNDNNDESWEIMCAIEGIITTEKSIKTQEKALEKLKKDHAIDKKELETRIQEYFRKNKEGKIYGGGGGS